MSAEANIRERLLDLCIGHGEWHIRKGNGICMTFSHSDSLDPEREAIAWLAEHQERYPERFAGYEVHRTTVQSELQIVALAVLDELDRLRSTQATPDPAEAGKDAWQPIETAPKDGTEILLGRAANEELDQYAISVPGCWQKGYEDGVDYMGVDDGFVDSHQVFSGGRSFGAVSHRYAPNQPTHWMPLPPPPSDAGEKTS